MKKPLFIFVFFILLLQVILGYSVVHEADNSLANMDEESALVAIDKKDYRKIKKIGESNCGFACSKRCRDSPRRNICERACTSCCNRCQCVPPGTYGNTHVCPCYSGLRTLGNRPMCP